MLACAFDSLISNKSIKISPLLIGATFFSSGVFAQNYYWKFSYIPDAYHTAETACKAALAYEQKRNYFNVPDPSKYYWKLDRISYYQWYPQATCMLGSYVVADDRRVGELTPIAVRAGDSCPNNSTATPGAYGCIYNGSKSQIGSPQEGTTPSEPTSCAGNPINFATGNKYQVDVDYKGERGLQFSRAYNSADGLWRHNYSDNLVIAGEQVTLVAADGRELIFTLQGQTFKSPSSEPGNLQKIAAGWLYTSRSNERFTFDVMGRLIAKTSSEGLSQTLNYAAAQVVVTDSFGQSLSFSEDIEHQPLTLKAGSLEVTYSYNSSRRLIKAIRNKAGLTEQRVFHYEDSRNENLLTGITDERGVRYYSWAYDDKGRAISSSHADGTDSVTVSYNSDGSSTVVNELGKSTVYRFQTIDDFKHIIAINGEPSANCANSNSTFTYDERGLLKTRTDNKGHLITYEYNSRGLEISRTEASGTPLARTITSEWHPTLFLPTVVTEPDRITRYQYDDQGRQLSRTVETR